MRSSHRLRSRPSVCSTTQPIPCHGRNSGAWDSTRVASLLCTDVSLGDVTLSELVHTTVTDYGVLTILAQDEVGGLEVLTKDGHWIAAPPIPGSFIVNIGDMLEIWTCGTQ